MDRLLFPGFSMIEAGQLYARRFEERSRNLALDCKSIGARSPDEAPARDVSKLIRQVHLAQKSLVAGIRAQAAEIRINLEPRDSRVSLHTGALSPLERLIRLAAPGVHAGDLCRRCLSELDDQLLKDSQ